MSAADIQGVVGIVPTPALAGADRWDARDTVNLVEAERMAGVMADAGVDTLLTNGTFGEGAGLMWPELQAFLDVVVRAVDGRVPVFGGATTLNTRDTVERGAALQEIGVDGLFLGRPMWVALDEHGIVQFYRDVAEALPEMPIVIYDNPTMFKGKISPAVYRELASIPQIVAVKHVGLHGGAAYFADLEAVDDRIRLLPPDEHWYWLARLLPDQVTACWSGNIACGPAPLLELRKRVASRDWDAAWTLTSEVQWALEPLVPGGQLEAFFKYNIRLDNEQFSAAGFVQPGPCRPPYSWAPEPLLDGAHESGRRWSELQQRYDTNP